MAPARQVTFQVHRDRCVPLLVPMRHPGRKRRAAATVSTYHRGPASSGRLPPGRGVVGTHPGRLALVVRALIEKGPHSLRWTLLGGVNPGRLEQLPGIPYDNSLCSLNHFVLVAGGPAVFRRFPGYHLLWSWLEGVQTLQGPPGVLLNRGRRIGEPFLHFRDRPCGGLPDLPQRVGRDRPDLGAFICERGGKERNLGREGCVYLAEVKKRLLLHGLIL